MVPDLLAFSHSWKPCRFFEQKKNALATFQPVLNPLTENRLQEETLKLDSISTVSQLNV